MSPKRIALAGSLAAAAALVAAGVAAAPPPGGPYRPSHAGHPGSPHGGGHGGHGGDAYWGWGLGLAIGVPLALGWYEPWWGPGYYPPSAYGPVYRGYAYRDWCAQDEDCLRERMAQSLPAPPTTEIVPAAPGADGAPTQRPLHLNYCASARAWFPQVRSCPGGWRLVLPEYNPPP